MPEAVAEPQTAVGAGGGVRIPGSRSGEPRFDPRVWERLPEIVLLAQLANEMQTTFDVPGSLAAEVLATYPSFSPSAGSLFDYVPPLSDVDVRVESWIHRSQLLSLLHAHLPISRFFHWDIRTESELARYDGLAFLCIEHEPTLTFVAPNARKAGPKSRATAGIAFSFSEGKLHVRGVGPMQWDGDSFVLASVEPNVRLGRDLSHPSLSDAAAMLLDVMYVARRFPSEAYSAPMQEIEKSLNMHKPRAIAKWFSRNPQQRQRLLRSALKLSYSLRTRFVSVEPTLGERLDEVANHSSGLLRTALHAISHPRLDKILVTTVRPKLIRGSWHPRIVDVRETLPVSATADDPRNGIVGPPTAVTVEDPSPAGCCHYRDFSRGVAEIAWSSIADQSPAIHTHLVEVDLGEGTATAEERPVAQAWVSSHRRHAALRVDYGFLCTLAGRRGPVTVQGRIDGD